MLFLCWNSQKFPFLFGGGLAFYYTSHVMKRVISHIYRVRHLNGYKNGSNLAENRVEYVLLQNWDRFPVFLSEPGWAWFAKVNVKWVYGMENIRFGNHLDWVEGVTGWRRLIGSPKLQIIFHKKATKYRALLLKMTYKDKGSYESSPICRMSYLRNFGLTPQKRHADSTCGHDAKYYDSLLLNTRISPETTLLMPKLNPQWWNNRSMLAFFRWVYWRISKTPCVRVSLHAWRGK